MGGSLYEKSTRYEGWQFTIMVSSGPAKLTVSTPDFRLRGMSADTPKQQFELELRKLESRINDLMTTCSQLKEENRSLRHRQEALIGERANLLQKNEQVRARVEGMITRLKAMETGA